MKKVSLSGSLRENVGKKDAKSCRAEGLIPCVIYGTGEQYHISVNEKEFDKIIFTPDVYLIDITVGDKTCQVILQDVQYHPVSDKPLHADFLQVTEDKPVKVSLPVILEGTAPGVMRGGKLKLKLRKLITKGLISNLPEVVKVDINELEIGSSVKVKDLEVENVKFLNPANSVIVGVKMARGATATAEGEEAEGEE
ncbi:MAG: 50S ribosomal protein L25 [Hyphomicrobiales bacterium]